MNDVVISTELQVYLEDFSAFCSTHPEIIITLCLMTAIIIIGWTNFICNHTIKGHKKKIVIILLTAISIFFISPLIPTSITALYFIAGLSISIATIGYDVILKKLPEAIGGFVDKIFNSKKGG